MLKAIEEIENWMERFSGLDRKSSWNVNENMEVDVHENIKLQANFFSDGKFPFQFGTIAGSFDCSDCSLTNLLGAPRTVIGFFGCRNNRLTSLEGSPKTIGGDFYCSDNPLCTFGRIDTQIGKCHSVYLDKRADFFSLSTSFYRGISNIEAVDFNAMVNELRIRDEKAQLEAQIAKLVEPYDRAKEGPLPSELVATKPKMKHKI